MAAVRRFLADHKLGVSIATVGLVAVAGGVAVASGPGAVATVTSIVDGELRLRGPGVAVVRRP